MTDDCASILPLLRYYDDCMKTFQLTEDESRASGQYQLFELNMRQRFAVVLGPRPCDSVHFGPSDVTAGAEWDQRKKQADFNVERNLENERLRQGLSSILRKKQDYDAVHTAWLRTMELHPTTAKSANEGPEAGGST